MSRTQARLILLSVLWDEVNYFALTCIITAWRLFDDFHLMLLQDLV